MYINNTHNNTSFGGQMIVIGKKNRNALKKIAGQVNNMRIVKNSKYNLYVSKGSLFEEPPVYISAQVGKPDRVEHFFESIKTVFHPDAIVSGAKRAIAKADKKDLQNKMLDSQSRMLDLISKIKNLI